MLPIQGGKSISDEDLHMQGDNEIDGNPCDNISFKNKSYSEMTIVYWAWKNLKKLYPDVKYIGLCHYRRFFAFNDGRLFITDMEASSSSIKIISQMLRRLVKSWKAKGSFLLKE